MRAKIEISKKLREVLELIKPNSEIAARLLSDEEMEIGDANYLSISESDETKISFLTQKRLDVIRKDCEEILVRYGYSREEIEKHFLQKKWGPDFRYHARPGALVQKIFSFLPAKEVEIFNNLYKSALLINRYKFEVVSGEDVKKYYHYSNYKSNSGSIGNSCMKNDHCQSFLSIYTKNPDIVKLLILKERGEDSISGRALLWNFDDNKVMDRIYSRNDEEFPFLFKQWAIENGYLYKHDSRWQSSLLFEKDGEKTEIPFSLKLEKYYFDKYPYMDTFKFLNIENGILSNFIPEDLTNIVTLASPEGKYLPSNYFGKCDISKRHHPKGELKKIDYHEKYKLVYHEFCCYSLLYDKNILIEDSEYCKEIGDYIFNKELEHLNDRELIRKYIEEIKIKEEVFSKKKIPSYFSSREELAAEVTYTNLTTPSYTNGPIYSVISEITQREV